MPQGRRVSTSFTASGHPFYATKVDYHHGDRTSRAPNGQGNPAYRSGVVEDGPSGAYTQGLSRGNKWLTYL